MKFLQDFDPQRSRFCSVDPLTMMVGAGAIQAGGSIFSGIMGKSAAKKQAEAIRKAQEKASGVAQQYNDRAAGWLRSFRERGDTAGGTIEDILQGKVNLDDMVGQNSLFKFQQETGTRDINRQLKARGLYGSGAGLETLARFEKQLLGEEGERFMGRLFQLNNQGQQAASVLSSNEINTGNTLANIAMQGGLGQAQAGYQGDMAITGMGKSLFDIAAGGMNNYLQYDMMKPILDKMAGKTASPTAAEISAGEHQEDLGRYIMNDSIMDFELPRKAQMPPMTEYTVGPSSAWSNF